MRPDTQLDYAIFQLTPTRTRCELLVAAQGLTYKLASGLFKPFVAHLRAAEEQLARGGYSIRLVPPDPSNASWFTKGTMERFVRFVSTPEVLERVSTVEAELVQLEETKSLQTENTSEANEPAQVDDQLSKVAPSPLSTGAKSMASTNLDKSTVPSIKTRGGSLDGVDIGVEENSKQRLLRALDARQFMLQKEQGMAFARAIAAGFSMEQMGDLVIFAECFGAARLREACIKFMALCKKRQEAGMWLEDLELAAAEANSAHSDMAFMGIAGENGMGSYSKSREFSDAWPEMHGRDMFLNDGRLCSSEDGTGRHSRKGSLDDSSGDFRHLVANMRPVNGSGMMGDVNGEYSPLTRARNRPIPAAGRTQLTPEELLQGSGMAFLEDPLGNGEYRDLAPSFVRGHPVMQAWQGQLPNPYVQNIHSHSPHGAIHPHLESPYGYALGPGRGAQPGLPYPPYMGSPYMQPAYAEATPWQTAEAGGLNWMSRAQPPVPPPYWSGNQGYVENPGPIGREHVDHHNVHHHEDKDNCARISPRDEEQQPAATMQGTDRTHVEQSPIGSRDGLADDNAQAVVLSPAPKLSDHAQNIDDDPQTLDNTSHDESLQRSVEVDAEVAAETRRLPRRSSSPSRRSSSPMRKVQIGRSGQRRSGMVVIRNINYIAPNSLSKGDNGDESSGSWNEEDGDSDASNQDETMESTADSVRVSVQDVIGLFEKKKDSNNGRKKSSRMETRKPSSKKSVLKRWTEGVQAIGEKDDGHEEDAIVHEKGGNDDAEVAKATNYGEESMFSERGGQERLSRAAHDVTEFESMAGNHLQKVDEGKDRGDDMMIIAQSERLHEKSSSDFCSNDLLAEQQGPVAQHSKLPLHDDSIDAQFGQFQHRANAQDSTRIDPDSEIAPDLIARDSPEQNDRKPLDDSFILLDRPVVQEGGNNSWRMSLNLESEMGLDQHADNKTGETSGSFEPDDLLMMPERREAVSRSWNSPGDYDMELLAADMMDNTHGGEETEATEDGHEMMPLENGLQEDEIKGGKSKDKRSTEREAKAKAMQEMLERRKAALGKKSDKLNPLAEAQLRAEKLRAYKAGLQKSKKEKEEEERKRIEDLKNQRRERIAARSSPGSSSGAAASPTPRIARSQPKPVAKPSPTAPVKLSSSSPRESLNGSSSLSPSLVRARNSEGNRGPRASQRALASPKPAEDNPLSRSVPSLSELRKESRKSMPPVRVSTGSQRFSDIKNNEKAMDSASVASVVASNGHTEEKKRPASISSTISARKSSPGTKEIKREVSPSVKPTKVQAGKPQKTAPSATGTTEKVAKHKDAALATKAAAIATQQDNSDAKDIDARNEAPLLPQENESQAEKLETTLAVEAADSPVEDVGESAGADDGYPEIRAPASSESQNSSAIVEEATLRNDEFAAADESAKILEESMEDTFDLDTIGQSEYQIPEAHAESQAESNGVHVELKEGDDEPVISEDYHAPIAHLSSSLKDSTLESSVNIEDGQSVSPAELTPPTKAPTEPPSAPLAEPLPVTPSKNLPQLREAIQQAHSPEATPVKTEVSKSRKKWGDSGPQKTSKEHAKGLKRLLLLGRKSSRSAVPNSSDWVSASTTSEVDEEGDEVRDLPSSSIKNVGMASSLDSSSFAEQVKGSASAQSHFKVQHDNSGSTSTKASRSFFSLSTFRSKGAEGKVR